MWIANGDWERLGKNNENKDCVMSAFDDTLKKMKQSDKEAWLRRLTEEEEKDMKEKADAIAKKRSESQSDFPQTEDDPDTGIEEIIVDDDTDHVETEVHY